jgi:hypothetical protein
MGVGYQVSALHRIRSLDMSSLHTRTIVKGEDPLLDALAAGGMTLQVPTEPLRFRSATVESILAWRQGIADKYRDQLGEELTWDERSDFEASEDTATNADMMLRYVTAVLDQQGQVALKGLGGGRPPQEELDAVFTEAMWRGFGGRFPQLLLGPLIWLPFERDLIIEELRWDGHLARYGTVIRLIDEITAVRAAIADTDPSAPTSIGPYGDAPPYSLTAVWQASSSILHLATLAAEKRLPLWTTG